MIMHACQVLRAEDRRDDAAFELGVESSYVRCEDHLGGAITPGATAKLVARPAPLTPRRRSSTDLARPHGTPVYPYGATG